jgi:hypothetical protein
MTVMPPTIMMAATSTPSVVMTATAVMAPPMTMAALDLYDSSIGAAESIRCCGGHCGCCSSRSKATECGKSNKCKFEFHGFLPVVFSNVAHSKKLNMNKG